MEADLIASVESMGEEVLIEAEIAKEMGADEEQMAFLAVAEEAARLRAFTATGSVYDSVMDELAEKEVRATMAAPLRIKSLNLLWSCYHGVEVL